MTAHSPYGDPGRDISLTLIAGLDTFAKPDEAIIATTSVLYRLPHFSDPVSEDFLWQAMNDINQ